MRARSFLACSVGLLAGAAMLTATATASAQVQGGGSYTVGQGGQAWGPGYGGYGPSAYTAPRATDLEMGFLYGFSAAYGVGTGIWLDAELGIDDPGIRLILPGVLGVGAPVGVYLADQNLPFSRGQAAAVATGMAIGVGEGLGIAGYQFVTADKADVWSFKGFSRSIFLGSTVGAAAGYAAAVTMEPSPKTSLLLGSSVVWGTTIGAMFGYGATNPDKGWGESNDGAALGGLIGYNAGLVGAAAISSIWVPTYKSLVWMWSGFGIGTGASSIVYLFYAGSDHSPRRGLIFQGTAATLGLVAGAALTFNDTSDIAENDLPWQNAKPNSVFITGGGPMPVPGGMGLQVSGVLF